jgi:hypothetical protein
MNGQYLETIWDLEDDPCSTVYIAERWREGHVGQFQPMNGKRIIKASSRRHFPGNFLTVYPHMYHSISPVTGPLTVVTFVERVSEPEIPTFVISETGNLEKIEHRPCRKMSSAERTEIYDLFQTMLENH